MLREIESKLRVSVKKKASSKEGIVNAHPRDLTLVDKEGIADIIQRNGNSFNLEKCSVYRGSNSTPPYSNTGALSTIIF